MNAYWIYWLDLEGSQCGEFVYHEGSALEAKKLHVKQQQDYGAKVTMKDYFARCRGKDLCCREEGCTCAEVIPCYLEPYRYGKAPDDWLCWEHASKNGYCRSCGYFSAGIESFDFNSGGFCEICDDAIRADMGEFDDDDDDYFYFDYGPEYDSDDNDFDEEDWD